MNDRTASVTGATGLVGSRLLSAVVADARYARVATLGRRAPAISSPKLMHYTLDRDTTDAFACDVVFCCLGTTLKKAGSREAFEAVDRGLVVDIAGRASDAGVDTFVVVSSLGADRRSGNFYLRTKGEMEAALEKLDFRRLGIVRPSLLLGPRRESRPGEAAAQALARMVNPLMVGPLRRYRPVTAEQVAAALIAIDRRDFSGTLIVESDELETLVETPGSAALVDAGEDGR